MVRDGPNFIERFQSKGFDARISGLYLFAAFEAAGFEISLAGEAPDFLLRGHGYEWAVEATTANPSSGMAPPALPDDPRELQRYIDGELVVRLGSALFSKHVGSKTIPSHFFMAHSPRAHPAPRGRIPGIVHHELRDDGLIASTMPPFHAFASRTGIVVGT